MPADTSSDSRPLVDLRSKERSKRISSTIGYITTGLTVIVLIPITLRPGSGSSAFVLLFIGMTIFGYGYYLLTGGSVTVGFECTSCGKHLSTGKPWICGYCDHTNVPGRLGVPSIVRGCGNRSVCCDKKPKSYLCDHCGAAIFFDPDRDARHPATAVGKPRPPIPAPRPATASTEEAVPDPFDRRLEEVLKRKRAFEREIEVIRAETTVVMTSKELEVAKAELQKVTSGEFERRMSDVERFALGDAEIIQAGADEEQKILANPNLAGPVKQQCVDRLRRYVGAKLRERKPN